MALSSSIFPSFAIFNASFIEPSPPLVATELSGAFLQHKWSDSLSHIVSGFWYNSATHSKVRIDETYDGSAHGSSLFDYSDMNPNGGVMNHQIIVGPGVDTASPECFRDYVDGPAFPLVTAGILREGGGAVFGGVVVDPFIGESQSWNLLFPPSTPVTVYLNAAEPPILLGYDFWSPVNRTKVVTRFFAHQSKNIDEKVFEDFVCGGGVGEVGREKEREEEEEEEKGSGKVMGRVRGRAEV